MKIYHAFIILILIIVSTFRGTAQPAETTYLGTVAKSGYDNNASYGPYNIGFDFNYFGNTYTQFYINSNGLVSFGAGSSDPLNVSIPDAAIPNNYIAAFWDDLTVDPSGNILYSTIGAAPNRKLVVQFRNMGFYGGPVYMGTFSIILYETSGLIQVQYRLIVLKSATRPHGESATIGIENADGSAGVLYSYNNPTAISSGQAIVFTPSGSTYSINSNAIYDGIYLTTNLTLPEPGITPLISPAENATIGAAHTFEWAASTNASSYSMNISKNSSLSGATSYNAGGSLTYPLSGLTLNTTYYWGVFASNATGTTWGEIKKFNTSSNPPLAAVPQTIYVEQNLEKTIKLNYTGGDASAKLSIITVLPAQGHLYQYNSGVKGSLISVVPTTVTDAGRNVIYLANGISGNSAGNFSFKIQDGSGDSPDALTTVNVSPPGIPNLLYTAKSTTVELQFDRPMANPSGKQGEFTVTVNGSPATITALNLKPGDVNSIIVTLNILLSGSESVLISYTAGTVSSVQGGWLASFTDQSVTLTAQTITFAQSLSKKYSDSPFTLSAITSSGLGLTYSSTNPSVVTASGSVLTFYSLGSSDITARQSGDGTYAPAKFVKTLTVSIGDQVVTFGSLPPKTAGDADFSPGATSSSGLTVSYSSGNSAVATIVGGMIHIVGGGTSVITASQAGNTLYNSAASVQQALTVTGSGKTLNLTVFLEGLYNGANGLVKTQGCFDGETPFDMFPGAISDTLSIQLAQDFAPYLIVYSAHGVPINTNGTISLNSIPSTLSGNYHIIIKHRNHIETWSKSVSFSTSVVNYNFTNAISQAWANNMVSIGSIYCIYTGDTNKDQYVDGFDLAIVFNLNRSGSFGYQISDINGDGFIDGFDLAKVFNNNKKGVGMNTPAAPLE